MDIKISQGASYEDDDWWKWWVWIDGTEKVIDQIDYVIYTLHSTFPDPVRKVSDRSNRFRLDSYGWGEFRIYVQVFDKSGRSKRLFHDLVLEYPDGKRTTA